LDQVQEEDTVLTGYLNQVKEEDTKSKFRKCAILKADLKG